MFQHILKKLLTVCIALIYSIHLMKFYSMIFCRILFKFGFEERFLLENYRILILRYLGLLAVCLPGQAN